MLYYKLNFCALQNAMSIKGFIKRHLLTVLQFSSVIFQSLLSIHLNNFYDAGGLHFTERK